jgi:hypothetical protein
VVRWLWGNREQPCARFTPTTVLRRESSIARKNGLLTGRAFTQAIGVAIGVFGAGLFAAAPENAQSNLLDEETLANQKQTPARCPETGHTGRHPVPRCPPKSPDTSQKQGAEVRQ